MYIREQHVVRALTIAGSDSGGGAGIQADLKTMHQFQVYGTSAVTALTAQNTLGVQGIMDVDPLFLRQQLQAVMQDIGADAVKTGMLSTPAIIDEVADFLIHAKIPHLVVDPVMAAKGGASLLRADAIATMKERLLPLAHVVTPNIPEAETLCGHPIDSWEGCRDAALAIADIGPQIVVIKGGHIAMEWPDVRIDHKKWAIDFVYQKNGGFTFLATPRLTTKKSHGTGCTYSAATASMLARGALPLKAVATAKSYVFDALFSAQSWDVGAGHGPTDHSVAIQLAPTMTGNHIYAYTDGQWIQWEDEIL